MTHDTYDMTGWGRSFALIICTGISSSNEFTFHAYNLVFLKKKNYFLTLLNGEKI